MIIKQYLSEKSLSKSPATVRSYWMIIKNFQVWLGKSVLQAERKDAVLYLHYLLDEKHLGKNSVQTYFIALRVFYSWAVKQQYVSVDPFKDIDMIKPDKRMPVYLTIEEMALMYQATKNVRDILLLKLLYSTGCRVSELIHIRKRDINLNRGTVKIFGKGSKERLVVIHEIFRQSFQDYIKNFNDEQLLFPLCQASVQKIIRKIAKNAGIKKKVTPHKIRHTFATHMLQAGVDIVVIQKMLGHQSLNTTQIYTHYNDEDIILKESYLPVSKIFCGDDLR
jgi:site-specific recombinase XerD